MRHADPAHPTGGCMVDRGGDSNGHLLVVEDDGLSAEVITAICHSAGYRVTWATNGREALALLATTPVDMVLLDVKLPDVCGLELLERMRASHALAGVPIVLVTALAMPAERRALVAASPADIVYKPFRRMTLLECVARHLPRL